MGKRAKHVSQKTKIKQDLAKSRPLFVSNTRNRKLPKVVVGVDRQLLLSGPIPHLYNGTGRGPAKR